MTIAMTTTTPMLGVSQSMRRTAVASTRRHDRHAPKVMMTSGGARLRLRARSASSSSEEEETTMESEEEVVRKPKSKPLPGSGVNLYDPAATASRWLTRRFGIVGGLGFVALLASVEGGEILKAVLERDVEGTNEIFDLPAIEGLQASDSRVGGGVGPKRGDFVGVNLTITDKENGTEYLNTKKAKRPIAFTYERKPLLAPVCDAIEEGVRTMKRGGVRRIFAPSAACFGERGVVLTDGTRIPGNRDLIIDITLEEVSPSYV
jgi:hypothetical protein